MMAVEAEEEEEGPGQRFQGGANRIHPRRSSKPRASVG